MECEECLMKRCLLKDEDLHGRRLSGLIYLSPDLTLNVVHSGFLLVAPPRCGYAGCLVWTSQGDARRRPGKGARGLAGKNESLKGAGKLAISVSSLPPSQLSHVYLITAAFCAFFTSLACIRRHLLFLMLLVLLWRPTFQLCCHAPEERNLVSVGAARPRAQTLESVSDPFLFSRNCQTRHLRCVRDQNSDRCRRCALKDLVCLQDSTFQIKNVASGVRKGKHTKRNKSQLDLDYDEDQVWVPIPTSCKFCPASRNYTS